MRLNSRGMFDARYTPHIARVDEGSMTSRILITRRDPTAVGDGDWDYDKGEPTKSLYRPVARTRARVVAQSAWSAQGYVFGDQSTVFQGAKFNIPFTVDEWLLEGEPVEFRDEDRIVIEKSFFPHLEPIKPFIYTVRSVLVNDTDAQWTLVTDVNLKGAGS